MALTAPWSRADVVGRVLRAARSTADRRLVVGSFAVRSGLSLGPTPGAERGIALRALPGPLHVDPESGGLATSYEIVRERVYAPDDRWIPNPGVVHVGANIGVFSPWAPAGSGPPGRWRPSSRTRRRTRGGLDVRGRARPDLRGRPRPRGRPVAGLSFDAAVLIGLDRGDERSWAWLRRAVERDVVPLVSAAAVAEAWRGGPYRRLRNALGGCQVVPVSDGLARSAGEAVGAAGAGTLDAVIAATAAQAGVPLLTDDPDDLHVLSAHFRSLRFLAL